MWNGTADTLKAKPDDQQGDPGQQEPVGDERVLARKSAIWVRLVEPVAP